MILDHKKGTCTRGDPPAKMHRPQQQLQEVDLVYLFGNNSSKKVKW